MQHVKTDVCYNNQDFIDYLVRDREWTYLLTTLSLYCCIVFFRQVCLVFGVAGGIWGISVSVRNQIRTGEILSDKYWLELQLRHLFAFSSSDRVQLKSIQVSVVCLGSLQSVMSMRYNMVLNDVLLARLMGRCCFARWHLSSSSSVTLPANGRAGRWARGGRAADTARRVSTVTSR